MFWGNCLLFSLQIGCAIFSALKRNAGSLPKSLYPVVQACKVTFHCNFVLFQLSVTGAVCASPARASCCGNSCWGGICEKGLGLESQCKALLLVGLLYLLWLVCIYDMYGLYVMTDMKWWLWFWGSDCLSSFKVKIRPDFCFLLCYCWNWFLCGAVILWDSVWNIPYIWKRAGCHRFLASYVNFPFRQEAGLSNFPLTLDRAQRAAEDS